MPFPDIPDRVLRIAAIVSGVAACVAVSLGILLVSTNGNIGSLWGAPAEDSLASSAAQGKLSGSHETVDARGIVHGKTPAGIRYEIHGRGLGGATADRVTFAAVGDVFATDMNFEILDSYAGSIGDGEYSFLPYYQELAPALSSYDVKFVNQETAMAGNEDGFSYSGYPAFNTPDSSADAMSQVGFDVVNFGSNHTWDMGEQGIKNSHQIFERYPEMMVIGSYPTQTDRDTVHMIERNGKTIAFLSYTYGSNSFDKVEDFPNTYYLCPFDKNAIKKEVARAQTVADAVVVYMHWGTEYTAQPDEMQLEYAQLLADLDVDLVIGSHAHILQPIKILTGSSGKKVPVVYGLSDLITGWTKTDTILSAMFTCDFVWSKAGLTLENHACYPLIEWSNGEDVYVRFLKDMSDEDMQANTRTEDVENDAEYLRTFVDDLGMDVPVYM